MQASVTRKLDPHYSSAELFTRFWSWQNTSAYLPSREDFFYEQGYNTKMWQATQYMPRLSVAANDIIPNGYVLPGKGHWGPNVYAGVRRDRCSSTMQPIRDIRATDTAVEVGA